MKFSRDSVIWTLGMLGAVVVGLATLGDPAQYGIPVGAIPYLRLGALLVGIISGKLATSPLPAASDAPSVNVTGLKPALVLALGLGVLTVSACGSHTAPVTSPGAQAAIQAADVVHALDAARDIAQIVSQDYPAVISAADFAKVLSFHSQAVTIIGAVPSGWRATVDAGLDQLQKDLTPAAAQRLAAPLSLVRTLVDAFVPAGAQ